MFEDQKPDPLYHNTELIEDTKDLAAVVKQLPDGKAEAFKSLILCKNNCEIDGVVYMVVRVSEPPPMVSQVLEPPEMVSQVLEPLKRVSRVSELPTMVPRVSELPTMASSLSDSPLMFVPAPIVKE